jgi:hypothetical protein
VSVPQGTKRDLRVAFFVAARPDLVDGRRGAFAARMFETRSSSD